MTPIKRTSLWLHRDDRGNIGVLLILTVFCLVALIAMVWNTGEFSAKKMRVQAVADTAAYSAAAWTSRTTNLIDGTNMVIVRTASAQVIALASAETIARTSRRLWKYTRYARLLIKLRHPVPVAAGLALLVKLAPEWAALGRFSASVGPAIAKIPSLHTRLRTLYGFQKATVKMTPKWIEQQRSGMERFYNCKIYLTQPRTDQKFGRINAPVKTGNPLTIGQLLWQQVRKDRRGWERTLRIIHLGRGRKYWRSATRHHTLAVAAITGHHVLKTQMGPLEAPPGGITRSQRVKYFAVLAVASTTRRNRPNPIMRYLFSKRPRHVVAYAAAETFNGNENSMTTMLKLSPWRLWSKQGWYWRPRLTHAEVLRYMARQRRGDRNLQSVFSRAGIRIYGGRHDIEPINLH